MTGRIIWKFLLSLVVLGWACLNLVPFQETPFDEYALAVSAEQLVEEPETLSEFEGLIERARARVEAGETTSLYIALRRIAAEDNIDLTQYFPEIPLVDISNLDTRNNVLLTELQRRAKPRLQPGLDLGGGVAFTFEVNEDDLSPEAYERAEQLDKAISIMRDRVDAFGVAEPTILQKGDNRIEVQMPGLSLQANPDAAERLGAPALLELSTVHRTVRPPQEAPIGYVEMTLETDDPETGELYEVPYYVKRIPEMTGDSIARAYAAQNQVGAFEVQIRFTSEGGRKFADLTERLAQENTPQSIGQLAIILDGKLHSAPTVRERIGGGSAVITGRFTQREALDLANVLNNPLEVGLDMVEMTEVSPTLAEDASAASRNAGVWGAMFVIAFMVFYYWMAGLVAVLSVGVTMLIVIGSLASVGATLSLPGVAALVLTIGMAVDGNILVFERIREELRDGKNPLNALTSGYDKVFSTIIDANVTTLITAMILYWLGSGPVKGFGLTLAVGIVASVFGALVVSRWMLEFLVHGLKAKRLLGLEIFRVKELPFLDYARRAFVGSWALVAVGLVAFVLHFDVAFGIDFRGGEEMTLAFDERISAEQVEQVAAANNLGSVNVTFEKPLGQDTEKMTVQTEEERSQELLAALQAAYPGSELVNEGTEIIGAAVGKEVTRSAIVSVLVALLGILFYVAVRFEFGYGLGAIVATIHDILMTIGIYVALGEWFGIGSGQFTAPMIASILMVVGYSINDSIVVFDRVREELTLNPGTTLRNIVHTAISRVLSRTILTSLTTLLATFMLFLFGAGVVVDFALVFLIGIFTGTFSSVFIASPVFFHYHKGSRQHVEERHILPSYDWQADPQQARPQNPKPATNP